MPASERLFHLRAGLRRGAWWGGSARETQTLCFIPNVSLLQIVFNVLPPVSDKFEVVFLTVVLLLGLGWYVPSLRTHFGGEEVPVAALNRGANPKTDSWKSKDYFHLMFNLFTLGKDQH